jgi:hypothetical protein
MKAIVIYFLPPVIDIWTNQSKRAKILLISSRYNLNYRYLVERVSHDLYR